MAGRCGPLHGGSPGLYTVRGGGYCAPQSRDVTHHVLLHDDNQFINIIVIEAVYHLLNQNVYVCFRMSFVADEELGTLQSNAGVQRLMIVGIIE